MDANGASRAVVAADIVAANARDIGRDLDWFAQLVDLRFKLYFEPPEMPVSIFEALPPPEMNDAKSEYATFVNHYQMSFAERAALLLALAPHVRPRMLDPFFLRNKNLDRPFTEFGGVRSDTAPGFVPTGETLVFILAGDDLDLRFAVLELFDPKHYFARHDLLRLAETPEQRRLQAPLWLSEEYVSLFTTGQPRRPDYSAEFPAQHIETELEWEDLIVHPSTRSQIDEVGAWVTHGDTLMQDWGMRAKLRPGYRALFHGPPGTGKTMAACLLGKSTGRDVYKIDLSLVISKYIGETEKNLARVFDQAEHKGWILFFDEADALFGKRSETKNAHDRYANQEVSFLLQRLETFDGITILASNLRENVDTAFMRRFESMVYFPIPQPGERRQIWQGGFSDRAELDDNLDFDKISREYELSGGSIMNVVRFASLKAIEAGDGKVTHAAVMQGIQREFAKQGLLK